jgi:hypothetical protein
MTPEHINLLANGRKSKTESKEHKLKYWLKAVEKARIVLESSYDHCKDILPRTETFQVDQLIGYVNRCKRGVELEIEKEVYTK